MIAIPTTGFAPERFVHALKKDIPHKTQVTAHHTVIGGKDLTIIAGPCSVESEEQLCAIAQSVQSAGATMLRGGAFKPRTSPYAFQGLQEEGLRILLEAKRRTGLPIVSELMSLSQLELFDGVDVIQIGARNMQNFELLRELGKTRKPILLKRGLSATIEELLLSAEYILAGGNPNVILCERGIRSFEPWTRATLDISAVPLLRQLTHLPVIVDPSHACGIAALVPDLAAAAVAAHADGVLIEVHNDPAHALSDGDQSITPDEFRSLVPRLQQIHAIFS